jgi:hypothetical protein
MTELFETGRRILAHGRRLFAAPPLAELPPAYASLLRDPGELLEELWGGVEHAEPAHDNEPQRLARRGGGVTAAEPLASASQWLLNSPIDVPQTPAVVSKAVPLRLSESRPRLGTTPSSAPLSSDERYVSQPSTVSSQPPLELAPERVTRESRSDSYRPQPVSGEQPAKIVEWPAPRAAAVGSAELATPGNVLQKMEEELGGEPELQRLRGQLEVEEGKRQLRQEEPLEVEGAKAEASRARINPSNAPAVQTTATSFSALTQLLNKNVARPERTEVTAAEPAPREPEVISAGESPLTRVRAEESGRADVQRADERGAGRGETAPLVEEVLEELYERLRLEFSRTYGTTGG